MPEVVGLQENASEVRLCIFVRICVRVFAWVCAWVLIMCASVFVSMPRVAGLWEVEACVLQCVAVCCSAVQGMMVSNIELRHVCCDCVAVCCSVL